MQVPFRKPRPGTWSSRLWKVTRDAERPRFVEPAVPPEPGGALLSLTLQSPERVTPAAIEADPEGAQRLPADALVRAALELSAENRNLAGKLHRQARKIARLERRLDAAMLEDSELRGRMATLEDVIAALHGNIEDLRLQRDQLLDRPAGS